MGSSPTAPANLLCGVSSSMLRGCEMMAAQETAVQANGSRVKKFFREVKAEMRKVSWPNKKELIAYTGVVFISVVFIAALIGLIDGVFARLLELFLR